MQIKIKNVMEFKLFATLNYVKKEHGWTQITEPQREKQCKDTHMGISLEDMRQERHLLLKIKKHKVLFFIILGHSCHKRTSQSKLISDVTILQLSIEMFYFPIQITTDI